MQRPPASTPALYAQDGKGYDAIVHAHYFVGGCDWFVTEYDADEGVAFGWTCLNDRQMAELGYTSLAELEAVRVPLVVHMAEGNNTWRSTQPVEYDRHWTPCTLNEAIAALDTRTGDRTA